MGIPVVIKPSGGMPVTIATNGYGTPMEVASNGYGMAVTQAANGLPVVGIAFGPTLQLTGNFVAENAAVNTTVGTVSVTSGTTGTPTYTLTDSASGKFNLLGSTLRTNAALDYETATSHNVTVSVSGLTPAVANATFTVIVTDVASVVVDAPVLDLLTDGTDNTPDFTLTGDLLEGDTVRFQYSTSAVFTGASETTNTIDAAEDAANALNFATGSLANNTWYFRARIERPGVPEPGVSAWSNIETVTISVVSSYTGPGDVITTGWAAWWGFRAFSAATRGTPCCRIKQFSAPNAEQDFNTNATTGVVDIAAITAFIAANGGGVHEVIAMYDQTATDRHITGNANFTTTALGSFMALAANSLTSAAVGTAYPQPFTFVAAVQYETGTGQGTILVENVGATQMGVAAGGAVDNAFLYAGTILSGVATEGVPHAIIGVFNGGSSVIRIGNTETSGAAGAGGITSGAPIKFGSGQIHFGFEGGLVGRVLDGTERTNLAANMKTYYGI